MLVQADSYPWCDARRVWRPAEANGTSNYWSTTPGTLFVFSALAFHSTIALSFPDLPFKRPYITTSSLPRDVLFQISIFDKPLIKNRHIPHPRFGIERQVSLLRTPSLQRSALHTPIRDIFCSSLFPARTVKFARLISNGVAGRYCGTACQSINNKPHSHKKTQLEKNCRGVKASGCGTRYSPVFGQLVHTIQKH